MERAAWRTLKVAKLLERYRRCQADPRCMWRSGPGLTDLRWSLADDAVGAGVGAGGGVDRGLLSEPRDATPPPSTTAMITNGRARFMS